MHRLAGGEPLGILLCSHGFKGYKDYGFIPLLCDRAARAGLLAQRFNFSHSGMTHRLDLFEHPEHFEEDRWSRQVSDLRYLSSLAGDVDHPPAQDGGTNGGVPRELPLVLFGHSRGGVSSLLAAGQRDEPASRHSADPALGQAAPPAALITAAAPDYACNLDETTRQQLRSQGRLLSPSGRTGQDLYVGRGWLDEIERDPSLYDPVLAAAQVNCPALILHGDGDKTVPAACAHRLHHAAAPNSRLEIIPGASHTFDCPNPLSIDTPWEEVPEATRKLIDLTVAFAVAQCQKAHAT